MSFTRRFAVILIVVHGCCCALLSQGVADAGSSKFFEPSPAWQALFNGHDLAGWRFLHAKPVDARFWRVEDGVLQTLPGGQWGADIITVDSYADFAFCTEWKVGPGGNSGILYNVREDQWRGQDSLPGRVNSAVLWFVAGCAVFLAVLLFRRGPLRHAMVQGLILGLFAVYLAHFSHPLERLLAYAHYMQNWKAAGLEMQIFDDEHFARQTMEPSHGNGALYDIFPPTSREGRHHGEWNESCVVVAGKSVEHWVNRQRILHYHLESDEFEKAVARSRYRSIAGITRKQPMRVALQNHDGQPAWFRGMRVRRIAPEEVSRYMADTPD